MVFNQRHVGLLNSKGHRFLPEMPRRSWRHLENIRGISFPKGDSGHANVLHGEFRLASGGTCEVVDPGRSTTGHNRDVLASHRNDLPRRRVVPHQLREHWRDYRMVARLY